VNHGCRRKSPLAGAYCLAVFAAITLIVASKAHAQLTGSAAAIVQFESDSNVFDLNTGAPLLVAGDSRRGDTFLEYGARFDLDYLLGRQQFFVSASTNRADYQHYTELDHQDYKVDAGLNWKLAELLDGKIDVLRSRSMVPFYDLLGTTTLSLETEQKELADVGLRVNSEWRIEGEAYTSKQDEPITGAPNLSLTETSGKVTVRYLGIARFTAGLYANYQTGSYQGSEVDVIPGIPANPDYHQYTGGFTTTYLSSRTTYSGQLGYSARASADGTDNASGVTGSLTLNERLTPKTSVALTVSRMIQSYIFNTGSEIDSSIGLSGEWKATYKLTVTLGYTYTYRDYPGQGNNPVGSERVDIQSAVNLGIDYRPLRWLSIRPYANIQWRISNYIGGDFNSNMFGVTVTAQAPFGK
jgi:hypothetical protein